MTTNDNPIEALRAVHEAATPGPWTTRQIGQEDETGECWIYTEIVSPAGRVRAGDDEERDDRDARAIAATHNVMPELLAVVDVLRRAVKAHQAARTQGDLLAVLDALADGPAALDALDAKIREALR